MNKKIYQLILVCLSLCLPSLLMAENVETIIAKHIEAHGGLEKWNKVDAIKITGQFTGQFDVMSTFTDGQGYLIRLQEDIRLFVLFIQGNG